MEESKPIAKVKVGVDIEQKTLMLQNLSDGPIVFEFASAIKGLEDKPTTVDPGCTIVLRFTVGVVQKEPEPASSQEQSAI